MKTVLRLLRNDARNWWYHKQLRQQNNHKEAREKEHRSIRSSIQSLRYARDNNGYASIGRGGWSIHYQPTITKDGILYGHCRVENYGSKIEHEPLIQACILLGIPVIDTTTIPDDKILDTLNHPMIIIGYDKPDKPRDDGTYGSLDYAPLDYVFQKKKELGATVYNWPK